eukprot:TRINITY_DN666_c0_g1_i1.p2 TRINITY_DN666_c0_g1~~TRINITY_DN666_c0_g1_i1.p2  ORF type:complete len:224 (+),score=43.32 TRINITY_DN666_c0_g1_i1:98-769(+)
MSWDDHFRQHDLDISKEETENKNEKEENIANNEQEIELSQEQLEKLDKAEKEKLKGNEKYKQNELEEALDYYNTALGFLEDISHKQFKQKRAIILGNRAAIYLKKQDWEKVFEDCSHALKDDPEYLKARLRRMQAAEKKDDLENAYNDATKILETEPGNLQAKSTKLRIEPEVMRRREKMKDEVLGKLKDLGNSVLGRFGISLDNFKAEQDPNTGGYSISYKP